MAAEAGNVGGCAAEINGGEGGISTTDDTDSTDGIGQPDGGFHQ
jgi:hypothetical protein